MVFVVSNFIQFVDVLEPQKSNLQIPWELFALNFCPLRNELSQGKMKYNTIRASNPIADFINIRSLTSVSSSFSIHFSTYDKN